MPIDSKHIANTHSVPLCDISAPLNSWWQYLYSIKSIASYFASAKEIGIIFLALNKLQ